MTNNLLVNINRKNDMYRDWKSTSSNDECENNKINFKTYDKLVTEEIKKTQSNIIILILLLPTKTGASPGFGRGGGPRNFFFRFWNLHVAN